MGTYDDDREFARELIADFGAPITFSRSPAADGTDGIGQVIDANLAPPTLFVRRGVVLPANPTRADGFEAGTAIRKRYRTFYAEVIVGSLLIAGGDVFAFEGKEWAVEASDGLAPDGGTPVFQSGVAKH